MLLSSLHGSVLNCPVEVGTGAGTDPRIFGHYNFNMYKVTSGTPTPGLNPTKHTPFLFLRRGERLGFLASGNPCESVGNPCESVVVMRRHVQAC